MNLDALTTSHAIQMPIKHAEEVEQTFDAIAYHKGASVVRMMHAFIGPDDFTKGLQLYMHKYQYGNATTAHLAHAWEETSGKPAVAVMQTWTEQMGFPVVTVKSVSFASKGKCVLDLHQEWFLADGSRPAEADSKLWMIPLFISVGNDDGGMGMSIYIYVYLFICMYML
jgi:aminopeptidase N